MSTTTLAPPQSHVDFVKSLPPEARGEVFHVLLQELLAVNGDQSLISIYSPQGEPFGQYLPAAVVQAQYEAALKEMPEEVRKIMTAPLPDDFDPDDVLTEAEVEAIKRAAFRKSQ